MPIGIEFGSIAEADARKDQLTAEGRQLTERLSSFKGRALSRADVAERRILVGRWTVVSNEIAAINKWVRDARQAAGVFSRTGETPRDLFDRARLAMNQLGDYVLELQNELADARTENDDLRRRLGEFETQSPATAEGHDGWRN